MANDKLPHLVACNQVKSLLFRLVGNFALFLKQLSHLPARCAFMMSLAEANDSILFIELGLVVYKKIKIWAGDCIRRNRAGLISLSMACCGRLSAYLGVKPTIASYFQGRSLL